jgi:transposase
MDDTVVGIQRFVDALDLGPLLRTYLRKGGHPYHPRVLLAVILLGMSEGVRSGRDLSNHCKWDARYRWFTGGEVPSARTFDRFYNRIAPFVDDLFAQLLAGARQTAQVTLNEVAIDGTKVPSSASWWRFRKESTLAPTDPDARIMASHGRTIYGFNAQIALDTQSGLIVGADLTNVEVDWHLAGHVADTVKRQYGEYPVTIIADAGYESPTSIEALGDRGIDSIIALKMELNHALRLNEEQELVCPIGKRIVQSCVTKNGTRPVAYFKPEGGCRGCPLSDCPFRCKQIQLTPGDDPSAKYLNEQRVNSEAYKGALSRRKLVEHPFASLKQHDKFGKFLRRGLAKARIEFLMWVISFNVRKLPISIWESVRLFWCLIISHLIQIFEIHQCIMRASLDSR